MYNFGIGFIMVVLSGIAVIFDCTAVVIDLYDCAIGDAMVVAIIIVLNIDGILLCHCCIEYNM